MESQKIDWDVLTEHSVYALVEDGGEPFGEKMERLAGE